MTKAVNLGGVAAMLAATAFYVIGDSMMKLAAEDLPPFEVLFLRGVAASAACFALIALRRETRAIASALDATTLLRATAETLCTLFYMLALASLPIADVIAIMQTGPLLVVLGAALFLRERIGAPRVALALAGFAGALMVAGPGSQGVSAAALFAFASAAMLATRDLLSRRVPNRIPVSVVTLVTTLTVLAVAGAISLAFEAWAPPTGRHLAYLGAAGVLVTLGNAAVMLAYRIGPAAAVAPFFYSFAVWGVLSGVVVWGAWPDPLALAGIALIAGSGVALVLFDQRRRRVLAAL
jgi:drug/metabolite transporter (DMT)-like permease